MYSSSITACVLQASLRVCYRQAEVMAGEISIAEVCGSRGGVSHPRLIVSVVELLPPKAPPPPALPKPVAKGRGRASVRHEEGKQQGTPSHTRGLDRPVSNTAERAIAKAEYRIAPSASPTASSFCSPLLSYGHRRCRHHSTPKAARHAARSSSTPSSTPSRRALPCLRRAAAAYLN